MLDSIPMRAVITHLRELKVFGPQCELVDKAELVAAARTTVGGAVDFSFTRFIDWLRSEGYIFAGFDKGPLRYDERCAYLRYDVHTMDLLPAYVLADLHERLGIVGSFQITWKDWPGDEEWEPYFVKLLEFDRRFVEFGLHAAPVTTWYINEKFGGDPRAAAASVDGEDFASWIFELYEAYCRDGDDALILSEIRAGADDLLSTIAASFRATFGELKSVSGHGNFLTGGYAQLSGSHPELRVLEPYFRAFSYFEKWGVERFGFDHHAAGSGHDAIPFPRMMFEGVPARERRQQIRGRVAYGGGFVALLHPTSWTCRDNAIFFLPEEPALG